MTVAVEKTAALNMFFTLVWEFLSSVLILKKKKERKEKSSSIQQTGDLYIKTSWSREYKICFRQMWRFVSHFV